MNRWLFSVAVLVLASWSSVSEAYCWNGLWGRGWGCGRGPGWSGPFCQPHFGWQNPGWNQGCWRAPIRHYNHPVCCAPVLVPQVASTCAPVMNCAPVVSLQSTPCLPQVVTTYRYKISYRYEYRTQMVNVRDACGQCTQRPVRVRVRIKVCSRVPVRTMVQPVVMPVVQPMCATTYATPVSYCPPVASGCATFRPVSCFPAANVWGPRFAPVPRFGGCFQRWFGCR